MKSVCVYCGSSPGSDPAYAAAATQLGKTIAGRGIELVYGGGNVGLMGTVADAAVGAGGKVTGVIPKALEEKEVGHDGLTKLHVVADMHERKAMMADLSEGFIAMPGGLGTLEELFEALTWLQLGFHEKPCGVLNISGYYQSLLAFLDNAVEGGFVKPLHREMLLESDESEKLLDALESFKPPKTSKWIGWGEPD